MKIFQLFANRVWKLESQNARLKNKHPLLFNVCHYKFVQSFVTQSLFRYPNLLFHFSFLTIKSSVIDFMSFTTQHPWPTRKSNVRISSNILTHFKQSVPNFFLLFQTSLCIANITASVILQQLWTLATFIGYSCVENNELYFLLFGAPGLDRHPVSRCLVTKKNHLCKLKVDK